MLIGALLSLFFIAGSCVQKEPAGKLIFLDREGNILGNSFVNSQQVLVAYRDEKPFMDKIGFQLYYFSANNGWKLISLASSRPTDPVAEVAEDLHIEDLPPGRYKINLIVNDQDITESVFDIVPDLVAGPDKSHRGGQIKDKSKSALPPRPQRTAKSK